MKEVIVAIAGLWVAVLLHGWTTRFMIVPLTGSQYNSKVAYLANRMTGEVYLVQGSRISGPLEFYSPSSRNLGKAVPTSRPEFTAWAVGGTVFALGLLGWCVWALRSSRLQPSMKTHLVKVATVGVIGAGGFLVYGVITYHAHVVSSKEDLTRYMDNARFWAATELQINAAIAKVREDQFAHDDVVIATIRPIVDVSQKYVQQLENHHPRTPPLRHVHVEYIEAWRSHYLAFATMVDSVEKKDYIQLTKANDDLLEAQRSVAAALADLERLMREAGLRSNSPRAQPSTPSALPHAVPSTKSKPTTGEETQQQSSPAVPTLTDFEQSPKYQALTPEQQLDVQRKYMAEFGPKHIGSIAQEYMPEREASFMGPPNPQPFGKDRR